MFLTCMKDTGTNILPFDIYFTDEYGNRVSPTGSRKITITLPGGYETPIACHLAPDGTVMVLDSSVKNGEIGFSTDHNSFCVIADMKPDGGSPRTGDNSNMRLWIIMMTASVASLAAFGVVGRKPGKQHLRNARRY